MSGTVFLEYRDRGVWATSTETAVLLATMVRVVEKSDGGAWWAPTLENWRVQACVRDLGITLDSSWSDDEVERVTEVISKASAWLIAKGSLEASELNNWIVIDGMHPDAGGTFIQPLPSAPVVEVADALAELLEGTLPPDPEGGWWFVGTGGGRVMLPRRS